MDTGVLVGFVAPFVSDFAASHPIVGMIVGALGAFTALMTIIARFTPTTKDDAAVSILEKIGYWADRMGIQTKKPK